MKTNFKRMIITMLTIVLAFGLMSCSSTKNEPETGKILLSVNPEIEIEYDKKGRVIGVAGVNADGRNVVAGYTDYVGKTAEEVTDELIARIQSKGYFDDDFNGHDKNLVVKTETGPTRLGKAVANRIASEANKVMQEKGVSSSAVIVDFDDLDDGFINKDRARELAMSQLGLTEAQFAATEYDLDDGKYEFKFTKDGYEYEYEVDAVTGKVLEADRELNDDWDDIDDDLYEDDDYKFDDNDDRWDDDDNDNDDRWDDDDDDRWDDSDDFDSDDDDDDYWDDDDDNDSWDDDDDSDDFDDDSDDDDDDDSWDD